MLHYTPFHSSIPAPVPAKPSYIRRPRGSGWPEHCPPIRAANSFGWDIINPFTMHFIRRSRGPSAGEWFLKQDVEVHSDLALPGNLIPHPQLNAWFWERGQQRPHVISDNVYAAIRHQVKVSTFLYLKTDPGEILLMRAIPNLNREWSVVEAVIETDWYFPAHPWHTVIELPRIEDSPIREIRIRAGVPLCRLVPLRRGTHAARKLHKRTFNRHFNEGQKWLAAHGRDPIGDELNLAGSYARNQRPSSFTTR